MFSHKRGGGEAVRCGDGTKRRISTKRGWVVGKRMRSIRKPGLQRGATNVQSSVSGIEDRDDEIVLRSRRASIISSERSGSNGELRETVGLNANFLDVFSENALAQLGLAYFRSQRKEPETESRRLEEENGNLVSTLDEYEISNPNVETKLKDEKLMVVAIP